MLQEKLEIPNLELIVRFAKYELLSREGRQRAELTGFSDLTAAQQEVVADIKNSLQDWFAENSEFTLVYADHALIEDEYYFYLDVVGPYFFPIEKVREVQSLTAQQSGQPVHVFVISPGDTVATVDGYVPYIEFSHRILEKLAPALREDLKIMIEQSNL